MPIPNIQKRILLFVIKINEQMDIKDIRQVFIIILGPNLSSKKAKITEPNPAEIFKAIPNKIISLNSILYNVAA